MGEISMSNLANSVKTKWKYLSNYKNMYMKDKSGKLLISRYSFLFTFPHSPASNLCSFLFSYLSHSWWCSGLRPGTVLKYHSWWRLVEPYVVLGFKPGSSMCILAMHGATFLNNVFKPFDTGHYHCYFALHLLIVSNDTFQTYWSFLCFLL